MRKGLFVVLLVFVLLLLPITKNQSHAAICSPQLGEVKVAGHAYTSSSIQDAYNYASDVLNLQPDFRLLITGELFTENLLFDSGTAILDGGYDTNFIDKALPTSLLGSITIRNGSMIVAAGADTPTVISPLAECAFDSDGDSYTSIGSCSGSADDCNDSNPGINPGAVDIPYDGIDQDCINGDMFYPEDFLPQGENCGRCHEVDRTQWDVLHGSITAPDTTCAGCHNALLTRIVSGHYGQIVRTAGNNMAAGETIVCNSCHDQISDVHNFGDSIVMDKVFAAWNSSIPITCDTCHESRASDHATDTAHDNRVIDGTCAGCHTSDTAVLGSPGSGTLISQADVDTLHRSDCTLCHAYTGTTVDAGTVRQAIQQGLDGNPVTCLDCHVEHHGTETNQVFYDPSVDTSQPAVEGCADCHTDYDFANGTSLGLSTWETILFEHDLDGIKDGSSSACYSCHNYDGSSSAPLADVQNAIASNSCTTCASCHTDKVPDIGHGLPTTGKHGLHIELAGISGCSSCHANPPDFLSGTDTNGDGLYDLSETDVCDSCHQDWYSGIPAEQDYKAGWLIGGFTLECNDCHAEVVDNGDNIPAGGRRLITDEFPVADPHAHYGAILDSDACLVCHDHPDHATATPSERADHSDGTVNLLDPDGGPGYNFVYQADLTSDPDLSNFCANCHDTDGATRLAAPLDPMDPFANGNLPPDVATRFMGTVQWNEYYGDFCFGYEGSNRPVNSHHDISDADQAFSGAKIECLDCHGAHTSAASQKLTDPFQDNVAWTGTLNEFCLSCHTGDHGPNDVIMPAEVSMPAFYTEPPANIPGENCGTGLVYDCAGTCVAQASINEALNDGVCDDQATPALDCNIFNFDDGDCLPLNTPNTSCGVDMVYDCNDNCLDQAVVDAALLSDPNAVPPIENICNDANDLDLSCYAFNYDYETCPPCPGNDCSYIGGIDSCNYDFAPWWIDASWTNAPHGGDSKRQWLGYSGAPEVPEMDCVVCHDAHGSYDAATNPGGNPYMLRDYVEGSQFLDDSARTVAGQQDPANWHPGTDGPVVITNPTPENIGPQLGAQFCVKCHSDWVPAYSWHAYDCTGCLTCHSHGAAWGTNDWGGAGNHQWCP